MPATDAAGPWSDPRWLTDAAGFDPSLTFHEGSAWYVGTQPRDGFHSNLGRETFAVEVEEPETATEDTPLPTKLIVRQSTRGV